MKKEGYFCLFKRQNGYWYYTTYNKFGRRIYKSTGEKKKCDALQVACNRAKNGTLITGDTFVHPKFQDFAKDFWNYDTCPVVQDIIQRRGNYSKRTAADYQRSLDRDIMPYFGKYFIGEISVAMINKWLREYPKKNNVSGKTANDKLINLRHILQHAVNSGIIEKNPAKEVKPLHKETVRKGCFTQQEIKSLFSFVWKERIAYTACYLAAKTGMRLGEIRALQTDQLHDDYIEVNAAYNDKDGRKCTKSGWGRIVPIDKQLHTMLMDLQPVNNWFFTTTGRVPVSPNFIQDSLDKHLADCGIDKKAENLSFHSFRHFFNTRLVAAGLGGELVRAVIGHESEKMTEHYLHLVPSDMARIAEIQESIG